jgi:hypothetical protein
MKIRDGNNERACALLAESMTGAKPKLIGFTAVCDDDRRIVRARIFTRVLADAKWLKGMVARDGIEPPTPAFSGPLTESPKWFEINGCN